MATFYPNDELRYLRRQELDQESKIIRDYYHDIIHMYGIDVNYYVKNTSQFKDFKGTIDRNTKVLYAYGFDAVPDYNISAKMISYMEVENDIFNMNRLGLVPNMDVNFYFDITDFACALATKLGQYKEYKIEETSVYCEVPDVSEKFVEYVNQKTGKTERQYESDFTFPYRLGLGNAEEYKCDILSGKMYVEIEPYEYDKEYTVVCNPYGHTDLSLTFIDNDDLYKAFSHNYSNDEYLQTLLYLTYTVRKVQTGIDRKGNKIYKNILEGKTHGGVLFYDISQMGKYADIIQPHVGDIVTIDFPTSESREQYEITQCTNKQLTQDGISPLLNTYVWKCQARRYYNQHENMERNEANEKLEEQIKFEQAKENEVIKSVQFYPNNEDAVYGGDSPIEIDYDKQKPNPSTHTSYEFIDDGTAIDLIKFGCGSKLVTTGYELVFIAKNGDATLITTEKNELPLRKAVMESGLKYLKASSSQVVFINISGESFRIVHDDEIEENTLPYQLDSFYQKTLDTNTMNQAGDNFYKFNNTRTYLFADNDHLYCKLDSNKKLYKLA